MPVPAAPLRVAVVQIDAHLAFAGYLREPLRSEPKDPPLLANLIEQLPTDSSLLDELEALQQRVAEAYERGLLARISTILAFCGEHQVDLVVFPEYSIPGTALADIQKLAQRHQCTVVAGSHHITADLLATTDYSALFAASDPPRANRAVAPILSPNAAPLFQPKRFPSQWEPLLEFDAGPFQPFDLIPRRGGRPFRVSVTICIDFLRHRDKDAAESHTKLTSEANLVAVPAYSPQSSARDFESAAHNLFQTSFASVALANAASFGGSGIFGFGRDGGGPLMPDSKLPPLPAGREAICIAALQLDRPTGTSPSSLVTVPVSEPVVYGLILHERDEPALAQVARALRTAPDVRTFRECCRTHRDVLAQHAIRQGEAPLLHKRWDTLARRAPNVENLDKLRALATDLWLPDDVLSLDDIERQLTLGCLQVLRGLAARPEASSADKSLLARTCATLERTCTQRKWNNERQASDELIGHIASVLLPPSVAPATPPAEDTVDAWRRDAGPVPPRLIAQGYVLWPADEFLATVMADEIPIEPTPSGCLATLRGYARDLQTAAAWLALRNGPPAWVGWSPGGTATLVVAPGHVVLVAPVVPSDIDLRRARSVAGLPLPVALLLGDCNDLALDLDRDIVSLDLAIQRLVAHDTHLRELAEYPYTLASTRFVPPMCQVGLNPGAPRVSAFSALNHWLASEEIIGVLCGAPGDGRTSLLRSWLAPLARSAQLQRGLAVYYLDCRSWRSHAHVSELFAGYDSRVLAALQLAIATGNCVLALDGLDDLLPTEVHDHAFFEDWVTDHTLLLLTTCWRVDFKFRDAMYICLCPAAGDELPDLVRTPMDAIPQPTPIPPRTFLAGATCAAIEHPPHTHMEAYFEQHVAAFHGVRSFDVPLLELLGDLAHALWSPRIGATHTRITGGQFQQHHARLHQGARQHVPPLGKLLGTMTQRLVTFTSATAQPSRTEAWLADQALRWVQTGHGDRSIRDPDDQLAFAWDPALHHALARSLVNALCVDHPDALAVLPLTTEVLDYCIQRPDWLAAQQKIQALLRRPPTKPLSTFNALALAVAAGLASTPDDPWDLSGADLRCARLDGARLDGARLGGASLRGASLRGASLRAANLESADLEGTDLEGADLEGATAARVRLTGARLCGARLCGARLCGADLSRSVASTSPDLGGSDLGGIQLRALDWATPPDPALVGIHGLDRLSTDHTTRRRAPRIDHIIRTTRPGPHEGAFVWSPDGHLIACGDARGVVTLWSSGPVRCLRRWQAGQVNIQALAFSPESATLAVASGNDVRLHHLADTTVSATLEHATPVTGLFWDDTHTLWTFAGIPRRWDTKNAALTNELPQLPNTYTGMLVAGGRMLAVVPCRSSSPPERSERVIVYTWPALDRIAEHTNTIPEAIAPDGTHILGLTPLSHLAVFKLGEPEVQPRHLVNSNSLHDMHADAVHPSLAWSHDGTLAIALIGDTGLSTATILCWNIEQRSRRLLPADAGAAHAVRSSPCDHRLAFLGDDGLSVLDLTTGSLSTAPIAAAWRRSNPRLAWTEGSLRLHDTALIQILNLQRAHIRRISMALHRERMKVVSDRAGEQFIYENAGAIMVWSVTSRQMITCHAPPIAPISHTGDPQAVLSHDEHYVLIESSASPGRRFDVWDIRTGEHRHHGHLSRPGSLILVVDGAPRIFADRREQLLHVVDPSRPGQLALPRPQDDLFVTPSGESLIHTAPEPRQLRCVRVADLLALDTDRPLHACPAQWEISINGPVTYCAFHEERELLATSSSEGVKILSLTDGAHIHTLRPDLPHGRPSFAPDGRHLALLFSDHLQLWDVVGETLVARILLLSDGGLLIMGNEFQRLQLSQHPPKLTGIHGMLGCDVAPLEQLIDHESSDLGARLSRLLQDDSSP